MTAAELLRPDFRLISDLVPHGARVLDLGCGDGRLLEMLRTEREAFVRGVELSVDDVAACLRRGLSVVQADIDEGLAGFADDSFDLVVLSQTVQQTRRPKLVLEEMLRVGRRGIVTFPNFGHWRVRGYLLVKGRMPVSEHIPYQWYDTPNIHLTTIKDFREFCATNGAVIEREVALSSTGEGRPAKVVHFAPNVFAEVGVAVVARKGAE